MQDRKQDSLAHRLWRMAGVKDAAQLVLIVCLVLAARTVIAAPFYVPSGSMEPTLQIGDELLAMKYAYGYSRYSPPVDLGPSFSGRWLGGLPERGEVVVFHPPHRIGETWVKRVIGLPGDRIQMIRGRLCINGEELPLRPDGKAELEAEDGSVTSAARLIERLPGGVEHPILKVTWSGLLDNTPEIVVPAGHVFMMGDNRDHSLDSRVPPMAGGPGVVPVENLLGRAGVIVGSWDIPNGLRSPANWLSAFRLPRFFSRID